MSNFNRIIIIGNLTRDPEYKQFSSGQGVTRFGIASNRHYKNRQTGALVQEVCFVDIEVFGPQAENCHQYLKKGSQALIEGRLKLDSWQTADGQNRSKHSIVAERIVFLQSRVAAETEMAGAEAGAESPGLDLSPAFKENSHKTVKTQKTSSLAEPEEFVFKDEQPFTDELPF